MTSQVACSAPGKLIIAGEHAVVHGYPSIASAINLHARVHVSTSETGDCMLALPALGTTITASSLVSLLDASRSAFPLLARVHALVSEDASRREVVPAFPETGVHVSVTSEIPLGAGLGSSASTCACLVQAVSWLAGIDFSNDELKRLSNEAEKVFHGTPSGIDTAAAIEGGTLLFKKGTIMDRTRDLHVDGDLVVVDTGTSRDTGKMVARVRDLLHRDPARVTALFEKMEGVVHDLWHTFKTGTVHVDQLGPAFNTLQDSLHGIGVSTPVIDAIIRAATSAGASGGKLTGAGGGGCVLVATPVKHTGEVTARLEREGFRVKQVTASTRGIKCTGGAVDAR